MGIQGLLRLIDNRFILVVELLLIDTMFSKTLLSTLLLALTVSANPVLVNQPPVTLGLTRKLNLTSAHNLLRHDQARAKQLQSIGQVSADAVVNESVDNQAVTYFASVAVGSPATTCKYYL